MTELKACGHCGGEALSCEWATYHPVRFYVECQSCWAKTGGHKTAAEAEASWNRRVPDPLAKRLALTLSQVESGSFMVDECGSCFDAGQECRTCKHRQAAIKDALDLAIAAGLLKAKHE